MAATKNSTANVAVGKGKAYGYMFIAPAGTALPSDNSSNLAAAYVNVGYLSTDGPSFTDSESSTKHYDMNADVVAISSGEKDKTMTVTMLEMKKDVLSVIYGEDNVTDANGVIEVHDKGMDDEKHVVVFELLLGDRKWRRIAPVMQLSELGDLAINSETLVGRSTTFSAIQSDDGDYYIDYIDSTETTKA